ncbi:pentapeptide repeat-containing protein [Terracoccus luteus]|uniref:Pentapeptide repeat protein n=1 Tax=Terracoccus luteus TaxID=53356 RepID=A0A839Q2F3_9MICO|nr:pentapeptide repeat-containing protein [Terracoccus luteus]MBB2988446.1 hypothetical protein [Terracoccus luteus]MCP2174099.1 hypothetical protein [Terracoccus luteus]
MAATVLLAGLGVPTPAQAVGVCPVIAPDGTPDRLASLGVDWSGCNLTGANLAGANLRYANLSDATLSGADLTGADLTGVNMTRAVATNVTFADVVGGGVYANADLTGPASPTRTCAAAT